jgi:hypothetical protein
LAVEHDIVPFDWADVFKQGEIDSIGEGVALTQDPGDFARLPVDDARQDQVRAAAGVHLFPQLAGSGASAADTPRIRCTDPADLGTRESVWPIRSRHEYAIGVDVIEMAPGDTTVGSTPSKPATRLR